MHAASRFTTAVAVVSLMSLAGFAADGQRSAFDRQGNLRDRGPYRPPPPPPPSTVHDTLGTKGPSRPDQSPDDPDKDKKEPKKKLSGGTSNKSAGQQIPAVLNELDAQA